MILSFSGTGNSRYCAQMLAHWLGDAYVDAAYYLRQGSPARLHSESPWVFVAPTYSWQLPRVFRDFLRSSSFSGCREAYFVMTCGAEIGDAHRANRALCGELGLACRGTLPVVMPDNYLVLFPAPEEGESKRLLAAVRPTLEQAAARIQAGEDFPPPAVGLPDRLKSGPVNRLFYRFFVKTKPFTVSSACISCGKCAQDCPLGNIHLEDGRPVWGKNCTHCMACLCGCPAAAIEYGKATRGKARYQCPPYQP